MARQEEMSQLIDTVFLPLFFFMRISGLPVPPVCTHLPPSSRPPARSASNVVGVHCEGKTEIKRKSSHDSQREPSKILVVDESTPKDRHTMVALSAEGKGTRIKEEEEKVLCDAMTADDSAQGRPTMAGPARRRFEKKSNFSIQTTNKSVKIPIKRPVFNRQLYKKRIYLSDRDTKTKTRSCELTGQELNVKQENVKKMHSRKTRQTTALSKSNSQSRKTSFDSETTERDTQVAKTCSKCRMVQLSSRMCSAFFLLSMTINAIRYMFIFYIVDGVQQVSAITNQIFFIESVLLFGSITYDVINFPPRIITALQSFTQKYGTAVYSVNIKRKIFRTGTFGIVFQIISSVCFVSLQHFFFPQLRIHLAPVNETTGDVYFLYLFLFAMVMNILITFYVTTFCIFLGMTYTLTKEFRNVTDSLKKMIQLVKGVASNKKSKVRVTKVDTSRQNCHKNLKNTPQNKRMFMVNKFVSSHTKDFSIVNEPYTMLTPCDLQNEMGSAADQKEESPHDLELAQAADDDLELAQAADDDLELAQAADDDLELAQAADDDLELAQAADDDLELEACFDFLRNKHEAICEIVSLCNKCLRHYVFGGFALTMPIMFIMIYTLSSGRLDLANLLFQIYSILSCFLYLTMLILASIFLNDAAHAPLDVIYAADWSCFTEPLLHKVQLFVSRLGHSRIGFDVYGLFVIDRNTVLMVVGTLVTYTVVVLQFQTPTCMGSNSTNCTCL